MKIAIFLITLTLSLFTSLHAQEELVRTVYDAKTNTWAKATILLGKLPAYGYVPVRVEMNNATKTDRELNLSFTSSDESFSGIMAADSSSKMDSSFSFVCKKNSRETVEFLVPLVTVVKTGSYVSTRLNMIMSCTGFTTSTGSMETTLDDSWPSVVMSNTLYVPNASSLNGHLTGSTTTGHHHYSGNDVEFAGDFDPKAMSSDWRSYIGQDAMIMTKEDWSALEPGARSAILEWNRMGSQLIIFTPNASDDLATLGIAPEHPGKRSAQRSFGNVHISHLPSNKILNPSSTSALVEPGSSSYTTPHSSLLSDYSGTWQLQTLLGKKNFHTALFILILLAFGVLVGPINLFVFAKAGKRHKLFITTPIISLGASALLVVIIMFQDGFGGRGHRVLLMEIQPDENKAYIFQEQIARTGVLLGSSFETSEPTTMTPVALAPSRWSRVTTNSNSPSSYSAKHGNEGLSVSGDWYQSRSIHGHLLKTIRPTRGRIELSPKAGAPTLVSTFDHDLGTIFYHAHDGSWWQADSLKKGSSVTLNPSDQSTFNTWLKKQSDLLARSNATHLNNIAKQSGRFFTVTENATATETYDSIKWLSTTTIMTGSVSR